VQQTPEKSLSRFQCHGLQWLRAQLPLLLDWFVFQPDDPAMIKMAKD